MDPILSFLVGGLCLAILFALSAVMFVLCQEDREREKRETAGRDQTNDHV